MSTWTEFKLIVTEPPRHSEHFSLIKNELVPFVERNSLTFWVTNYFSPTSDYILFRIKCPLDKSAFVQDFLNDLKRRNLIADWHPPSSWDPATDAQTRIDGLRRFGYDPNTYRIVGCNSSLNRLDIQENTNIEERRKQLTALFESLGECTKAIYKHLETKPKDLWIASLFIHLILNSMDYSGPNPPSEETSIRQIPPV
jgi:hypothetical protein